MAVETTEAEVVVAGMISTLSNSSLIQDLYRVRLPSKISERPRIPSSTVLALCGTRVLAKLVVTPEPELDQELGGSIERLTLPNTCTSGVR
ncbi:hypothetical protein D3C72_2001040 [compost metagenome]